MDAESKERARDYLAADIFLTTFDWPESTLCCPSCSETGKGRDYLRMRRKVAAWGENALAAYIAA